MSEENIIEAVARAIDPTAFAIGPAQIRRAKETARAAIEAYEAAKMNNLVDRMLIHEVAADGTVTYVELDKTLENSRQTNKWMSDALKRLAERKP